MTAAEALAEPGGICVSRAVRDQVRDRLDFAFEEMGNLSWTPKMRQVAKVEPCP